MIMGLIWKENIKVCKKKLDINSILFYTLCGSHGLNLMFCDMVNCCPKVNISNIMGQD